MADRKKLEKALSKVPVNDLREIYNAFAHLVVDEPDFIFTDALYKKEDGSKKLPDFTEDVIWEKCISRKDIQSMNEHAKKCDKKMKKAEVVKALADLLSNDAFVEAISFASIDNLQGLISVAKALGAEDCFTPILEDPVFIKRADYLNRVRQVVVAAVNLYGVISFEDVYLILKKFEAELLSDREGYERTEGSYQKTMCFKPCDSESNLFYTLVFLQRGSTGTWYACTSDRMMVHSVFFSDVLEEIEFLLEYGTDIDEDDAYTHRLLINNLYENDNKNVKRYLPDRETFFKYCDMEKNEMFNLAEKNFLRYLRNEIDGSVYMAELKDSSVLAYFKAVLGVWDGSDEDIILCDVLDTCVEAIENLEIYLEDEDEFRALLEQLMPIYKTSRLWNYRGFTRKEARGPEFKKAYLDKLVKYYELDERVNRFDEDFWDDEDFDPEDPSPAQMLEALKDMFGGLFDGEPDFGKDKKKKGPFEIPGQLTFDFGDDD